MLSQFLCLNLNLNRWQNRFSGGYALFVWYTIRGNEIEIRIYVKPNAKRSEITGVNEQGLCVALHARPTDGAANKELIRFLSDEFHIPVSKILIRRGMHSRHKSVMMPLTASVKLQLDLP